MRQVFPRLWLGTVGEFGDAQILLSNNIELAILCQFAKGAPHNSIPAIMLRYEGNGTDPDWYLLMLAQMIQKLIAVRQISLHDDSGGLQKAAGLLLVTQSMLGPKSFDQRRTDLEAIIGALQLSDNFIRQGVRLWP